MLFYKKSDERYVGWTASKKVGNSIKRNLARRRLKAIFVELDKTLQNGRYVIVAKKEIENIPYKKLKNDIQFALKRVGALKK